MKSFTNQSFSFLEKLKSNNNSIWWHENKEKYITYIKEPLISLSNSLGIFGEPHIFRPNRDVLFTPDKSPYKLNGSFFITQKIVGIYFEIISKGSMLGGGLYEPASDQLLMWRKLLDKKEFVLKCKTVIEKMKNNNFTLSDNTLKTAPRGWPADHPEIELLRLKSLTFFKYYTKKQVLESNFEAMILQDCKYIEEWNSFLQKYIKASSIPVKH